MSDACGGVSDLLDFCETPRSGEEINEQFGHERGPELVREALYLGKLTSTPDWDFESVDTGGGSERESETNWPNETPILARLIEQMGESWPHFRITEHIDQHERSYTLIEWGDADTNFDPTAPNDFVSFVENRPEPTEKQITERDHQ